MSPEEKARQQIDAQLTTSGWVVQTKDKINLSAARGWPSPSKRGYPLTPRYSLSLFERQ